MATPYVVTIMGELQAQLVMNQLTFLSDIDDPTTTNAYGLLQSLGFDPMDTSAPIPNSVLDTLLQAQTTAYQMNEIVVRSLTSVIDFITQPVTGVSWAGGITVGTGDRAPTFVAARIRTNRVRTDIRRGTLALTPPTEENIDASGNLLVGQLTVLQALCTELNEPMATSEGAETTLFLPAVLKKQKYTVPDTIPPTEAYRYYSTASAQLANAAYPVVWEPVGQVTSQVSRRVGKGA